MRQGRHPAERLRCDRVELELQSRGPPCPSADQFGGGDTINTKTARIVHTTIEVPFDEAFSEVRCRPFRFVQEDRERMGRGKLGVWGGDPL